jgi:hypothetical protein
MPKRTYVKTEVSEQLRREIEQAAAEDDRTVSNWLLVVVKKALENRRKRKDTK